MKNICTVEGIDNDESDCFILQSDIKKCLIFFWKKKITSRLLYRQGNALPNIDHFKPRWVHAMSCSIEGFVQFHKSSDIMLMSSGDKDTKTIKNMIMHYWYDNA